MAFTGIGSSNIGRGIRSLSFMDHITRIMAWGRGSLKRGAAHLHEGLIRPLGHRFTFNHDASAPSINPSGPPRGRMLALEPRMMFDAVGFSDAADLLSKAQDAVIPDPPHVTAETTARSFATDGMAVPLPRITLATHEQQKLAEVTLELIGHETGVTDKLDFSDTHSIIGRWDEGMLTLKSREGHPLSAAQFQAALNEVTYLYRHTGTQTALTLEDRNVRVTVVDEYGQETALTLTLKQDQRIAAKTGLDFAPTQREWGDAILFPDLDFVEDPKLEQVRPANMLTEVGFLVANILGNRVDDPDIDHDSDPQSRVRYQGMAIVALDDANGQWQYSTDGGTQWSEMVDVRPESALLLTATTRDRIRFVPNPDFIGETFIEFRAWDVRNTTEAARNGTTEVDTLHNGGTTPYSTEIMRWTTDIVPGATVTLNHQLVSTAITRTTSGILPGNSHNHASSLSADGRYLVFTSDAANLVSGDTNGYRDLFLRDNQTGETRRISNGMNGQQANGNSDDPVISGDGGTVVFTSAASNLVSGDNNFRSDVFRYTLADHTLSRVSLGSSGIEANDASFSPDVSSTGDRIVFVSRASNLVKGDDNGRDDVFLRDETRGETLRLSVAVDRGATNGASFDPAISGDGQWVVYASDASNVIADDTNGTTDLFMVAATGTTPGQRLQGSAPPDGPSHDPDIGFDGRRVVFSSHATNLSAADVNGMGDLFLYERDQTGECRLLSFDRDGGSANGASADPALSADGRFVTFLSRATDLDNPGIITVDSNESPDLFHHSIDTGQTIRISQHATGIPSNGLEFPTPAISGDGRWVSHVSTAGNLVDGTSAKTTIRQLFLAEINIAPRFDDKQIEMKRIFSESEAMEGVTIAELFGQGYVEVNSGDARGIAVTRITGDGHWQFSTNLGANWSELSEPAPQTATLLKENGQTRIRFIPEVASREGEAAITFHPWDGTVGLNAQRGIGLALIGGATSIGKDSVTVQWRIGTATAQPVSPQNVVQHPLPGGNSGVIIPLPDVVTFSKNIPPPPSPVKPLFVPPLPRGMRSGDHMTHGMNIAFSLPARNSDPGGQRGVAQPVMEHSFHEKVFRGAGGLPWKMAPSLETRGRTGAIAVQIDWSMEEKMLPNPVSNLPQAVTPVPAPVPVPRGDQPVSSPEPVLQGERPVFAPVQKDGAIGQEPRPSEPASAPAGVGQPESVPKESMPPVSGRPGFSRQVATLMAAHRTQLKGQR